jgi:hypothetical protein
MFSLSAGDCDLFVVNGLNGEYGRGGRRVSSRFAARIGCHQQQISKQPTQKDGVAEFVLREPEGHGKAIRNFHYIVLVPATVADFSQNYRYRSTTLSTIIEENHL